MTPQFRRPLFQVLVVRVDIGVVIYEVMTPQCGRSVVQVPLIRVSGDTENEDTDSSRCRKVRFNIFKHFKS